MAEKYEILPVPTRILTVHDNIVDAIKEFGGSMIGPRDVVCVAESVVAITQNRAIRPETLKIGFAAKVFSQLFPGYGSISNWSAMQSLINEEGTLRITFAVVAGFFMKLIGKAGWFYRLGGNRPVSSMILQELCHRMTSTLSWVRNMLPKWRKASNAVWAALAQL